ncbi:hypothetical protein [Caulobacter sp. DWR2-3-1b2]|uniref:hypothetical protein n=1 Tax=unclassified Caulobacter TaxID=2648921 RepID=UPI003CEB582B
MIAADPVLVQKRVAYVKTLRGLYRGERAVGMMASLIGVLLLIWGRQVAGAPAWAVPTGLVTIGAAWLLFAYVIYRRTRYVRAHPFDPQS